MSLVPPPTPSCTLLMPLPRWRVLRWCRTARRRRRHAAAPDDRMIWAILMAVVAVLFWIDEICLVGQFSRVPLPSRWVLMMSVVAVRGGAGAHVCGPHRPCWWCLPGALLLPGCSCSAPGRIMHAWFSVLKTGLIPRFQSGVSGGRFRDAYPPRKSMKKLGEKALCGGLKSGLKSPDQLYDSDALN